MMAAAKKKPTPYSKMTGSAKKKAVARPGSGRSTGKVGGSSGVRSGRRPMG